MGAPAPVGDRPGPEHGGQEPAAAEQVSPFALLRTRGRIRSTICLVGPAFVAAVAYIDPGNFATNFAAGAHFGYTLIWVVLVANLVAMLVQYQSAKVGVVTGRDLPELCRDHFPKTVAIGLWLQAEIVAMATDIAEFVGAALGLNLLFGVPLLPAGLITAVVAYAILAMQQQGYRRFELVIAGLLGIVLLGFAYDLVTVGADPAGVAGGLVPGFAGSDSLVLATGIVGATVMPHVVYLHSALTKSRVRVPRHERTSAAAGLPAPRRGGRARRRRRHQRHHVDRRGLAVPRHGAGQVDSIEAAHAGLARMAGGGAALAFAVALLASGLSSSSVGTYAGQVVMQGFIRRRIPLMARRTLTMLPALLVLAAGLPLTQTLVLSQVLLSFGIPFALVPLARHDQSPRRHGRAGQPADHHARDVHGRDARSAR